MWLDTQNGPTKKIAHSETRDQLLCVATGELKITVVSPWERDVMYIGSATGMPTNFSPVDFFKPDTRKHSNFKAATPFDINLKEGDCLYLPGYWWQ